MPKYGQACCTSVADRQLFLVTCRETGAEGIWSPGESGTFDQWEKEHDEAHLRKVDDDIRREMSRDLRRWALHTYRTTEPGDSRRRGIGPYL